ncbi:VWA domain-containing protein [Paenibacillus mesophilus]|uniref:vWA domain-containing protein n=1 Tax=Paenibacillus mesophilus TaxID=2582849 RepID=UPI00110DAEEE|nr:vWA domain-containing protein [Paenibacillus mesophilus]TMV45813.1 VWA domain-containing protein [Paenibacillus mesophilus]
MIKHRTGSKLSLLSILLIVLILLAGSPSLHAAQSADQKMDAVLAMDASTSMNDSDKNKVANEAMKMFVDMASVSGDKIGLISYTDQIVREKALLKINSAGDKEELKSFIDQLARGPYTDVAVGVAEAVKILESGKEAGHYPLIVLLSDGNNSLRAGRTQAQSDAELQAAVKKAKEQSIPIYTIGLNADGQLNKDVLDHISRETGGKLFVTSTADTLPQILSEIFANHLKLKVVPLTGFTANGDYQDVTVSIPNGNVMEANVSIMSTRPVEVKLFDPSGAERKVPSDGVVYSKSAAYSLVKLIKPPQGDWKLQIKGVNQDKININLVYNYDLALVMTPLSKTYKAGDTVQISARLESNGQTVADPDLYKNLKSTLLLTDLDAKQTKEIALTNSGKDFTGSFKIGEPHDYEVKVRVEDSSFFRETNPATISAKSGAQQPAATPVPAPAPVPAEDGKPFPWTLAIGGGVLLIVLLAALLFILSKIKQANKGFYGQIVIEIFDEDTGDRTSPQYKKLNGFKGKVKLHQLLQLAPEFAETEQIVFTPGSDSVFVTNQSPCVLEKSGRAFDATKAKELKKNDRIKITLQSTNKSIWLEYIH